MRKEKPTPNHRLRQVRRNLLLTIEEAAEMIHVSATSFGCRERGIQRPHLSTIRELCEAFKKTAEELYPCNILLCIKDN